MAKIRNYKPNYRTYLYKEKQVKLRSGYGWLPEDVRKVAEDSVSEQTSRWNSAFGYYNMTWQQVVVPVLENMGVPKLNYALYRAFMNRLLSKVYIKGSQTKDSVINDFTTLFNADTNVLNAIVDAIEKAGIF